MKKAGTYGEQVAARFKKQYYIDRSKSWRKYDSWTIQPKEMHTIVLELKSKKAIVALTNGCWVKGLKKPGSVIKSRSKK